MSAPSTATLSAPQPRAQTSRISRLAALHGAAIIAGLIVAWEFVPAAHTSPIPFALYGAALFLGTYAAGRAGTVENSPLRIDTTVRFLRSMFAVSAAAISYVVLDPQVSSAPWRSALGLAVSSGASCIGSQLYRGTVAPSASASSEPRAVHLHAFYKRCFDFCAAALVLLLLLPVLIAIAFAVAMDSRGSIFFSHERIGRNGERFRIFKFRSMYPGSPSYQRSPTDRLDPRITRVGRVLRRLSLDELPQLLNVLRGEMSLVGPRPEMPFMVAKYTSEQRRRLHAVPGITGLWQISPARALPIHENLQYDLYYIEHQSPFLDLAILFRTMGSVIRGIGAA